MFVAKFFPSCQWHVLLYINCEDCDGTNAGNRNDRMFYHAFKSRPLNKCLIHELIEYLDVSTA